MRALSQSLLFVLIMVAVGQCYGEDTPEQKVMFVDGHIILTGISHDDFRKILKNNGVKDRDFMKWKTFADTGMLPFGNPGVLQSLVPKNTTNNSHKDAGIVMGALDTGFILSLYRSHRYFYDHESRLERWLFYSPKARIVVFSHRVLE